MKYWLLAVSLACAGCLRPNSLEPLNVHTMDPVIRVASFAPLDKSLGIRPLKAARPYETVMTTLDERHLIQYQPLDTWAESPGDYVTRALLDALTQTGRFLDVGNAADMARPDFILTGEIRKFHQNRTVSPAVAELEVRLAVREARRPGNVWEQLMVQRVPVQEDSPAGFAKAMEKAIAQLAVGAAEGIAGG